MARKATNILLQKAKKSKNDEFYTQFSDIEKELQYYKSHFENKIVYCNCDDPHTSNFFKYFVSNFKELGLKKVIAACYNEQILDLFQPKEKEKGFFAEYSGDEIEVKQFKGDGDFRSKESIALLQKADIVVTNPPFSLFREYVAQLVAYNKNFLIIGNINAITYKEIFKLIQENKVWLGVHFGRGISGFIVPEYYEVPRVQEQRPPRVNPLRPSPNFPDPAPLPMERSGERSLPGQQIITPGGRALK